MQSGTVQAEVPYWNGSTWEYKALADVATSGQHSDLSTSSDDHHVKTTAAGSVGAVQYSDGSGGFLGNNSQLYVDSSSGKVGVNTNSPPTDFFVDGNVGVRDHGVSGQQALSFGTNLYFSGAKLALYEEGDGSGLYGFGVTAGSVEFYTGGEHVASYKNNGDGFYADAATIGSGWLEKGLPSVTPPADGAIIQGNVGVGGANADYAVDINGALGLRARDTDPTDLDSGESVLWNSTGQGSGDDGDLMAKITDSGGTTKLVTIVSFAKA
jgi:hypothetical protein